MDANHFEIVAGYVAETSGGRFTLHDFTHRGASLVEAIAAIRQDRERERAAARAREHKVEVANPPADRRPTCTADVAYKAHARDGGLLLNVCPFCGRRVDHGFRSAAETPALADLQARFATLAALQLECADVHDSLVYRTHRDDVLEALRIFLLTVE